MSKVKAVTHLGLLMVAVSFSKLTCGTEPALGLEQIKAHYLVEIARNSKWPDDSSMQKIRVGVLGSSPQIVAVLSQDKGPVIRGKALTVKSINLNHFDPNQFDLIYISQNKQEWLAKLFPKVTHTLLISDGIADQQNFMMSLVYEEPHIRLKLNRNNLVSRGFEISSQLLQMAGSKQDLGDELRAKESALANIAKEVVQKEQQLERLRNDLFDSKNKLDKIEGKLNDAQSALSKNQIELDRSQVLLRDLLSEVESSESQMEANLEVLNTQQRELENKQIELAKQESIINMFKTNIAFNKSVLEEQVKLLDESAVIIAQKQNIITSQKFWLGISLITVSLFLTMSYYLYRENKLKKIANAQLFYLATTDGLTQLFNRRHFLESAQIELIRQIRHENLAAMVMVDIDNFKSVNDTHGHMVGDEVIKNVATILKNGMRQYDLIGRMGGEEFAMMLIDCDSKKAKEIAHRLCQNSANSSVCCGETMINVTISIGLSQLSPTDTDAEQPLARADKALYQSKRSGRNRVVLFEEMEH